VGKINAGIRVRNSKDKNKEKSGGGLERKNRVTEEG
jgi:hypothetical protein